MTDKKRLEILRKALEKIASLTVIDGAVTDEAVKLARLALIEAR